MEPITGVKMDQVIEAATKAFDKIATARMTDYTRGLMLKEHNQRMKVQRLRDEADAAEKSANETAAQIERLRSGDWSSVEPLELADVQSKEQRS